MQIRLLLFHETHYVAARISINEAGPMHISAAASPWGSSGATMEAYPAQACKIHQLTLPNVCFEVVLHKAAAQRECSVYADQACNTAGVIDDILKLTCGCEAMCSVQGCVQQRVSNRGPAFLHRLSTMTRCLMAVRASSFSVPLLLIELHGYLRYGPQVWRQPLLCCAT